MKLKYQTEIFELDGNYVAMPVETGEKFHGIVHLNETAADILRILEEDVTEDKIVMEMEKIYDASEDELRQGIRKLTAVLRENQLLLG